MGIATTGEASESDLGENNEFVNRAAPIGHAIEAEFVTGPNVNQACRQAGITRSIDHVWKAVQ